MSFTRGEINLPTEPKITTNISDMKIEDSATTDDVKEGIVQLNGLPNEPSSNESLSLSCTFPLCFTISSPRTLLPDSRADPSEISCQSYRTSDTDLLRRSRSPKPPQLAGAIGSEGAPHRRATSATEDDTLHHESLHSASASAAPSRGDPPDGPGLAPQDDRHLHRRTTLDMGALNVPAGHELI